MIPRQGTLKRVHPLSYPDRKADIAGGQELRARRRQHGLTQPELAKHAGITPMELSVAENGNMAPRTRRLIYAAFAKLEDSPQPVAHREELTLA
jgi:transcriptional regulator with XRE-family HTH domain